MQQSDERGPREVDQPGCALPPVTTCGNRLASDGPGAGRWPERAALHSAQGASSRNRRRACAPSPRCSMACCCRRSSMPAPRRHAGPCALAGLFTELSALQSTQAGAAGVAIALARGRIGRLQRSGDARQPGDDWSTTPSRPRAAAACWSPAAGAATMSASRSATTASASHRCTNRAQFDEFFQVGNPERDARNGFGLGLIVLRSGPLLGNAGGVASRLHRRQLLLVRPAGARRHAGRPALLAAGPRPGARRDALAAMLASWGLCARTGGGCRGAHWLALTAPAAATTPRCAPWTAPTIRPGPQWAGRRASPAGHPDHPAAPRRPRPVGQRQPLARACHAAAGRPCETVGLAGDPQRPQHGARRRPEPGDAGVTASEVAAAALRRSASKQLTRLGASGPSTTGRQRVTARGQGLVVEGVHGADRRARDVAIVQVGVHGVADQVGRVDDSCGNGITWSAVARCRAPARKRSSSRWCRRSQGSSRSATGCRPGSTRPAQCRRRSPPCRRCGSR